MIRRLTLAIRFTVFIGGLLVGAEAANGQGDPQSAFEPRSEPGTGQTFLEGFAGNWEVTKTFFPKIGDPVKTTGTCRQAMIHRGRFLKSEFVFQSPNDETTGLGVIGWDPTTKKFTSFWTDSRSTRISIRQSDEAFDGKQIVLYSCLLDQTPSPTARNKSKTISRLEDDGRKIVHRQYVLDPGKDERLVMEMVLVRKAQTPSP